MNEVVVIIQYVQKSEIDTQYFATTSLYTYFGILTVFNFCTHCKLLIGEVKKRTFNNNYYTNKNNWM